jgi:hypothetical protein
MKRRWWKSRRGIQLDGRLMDRRLEDGGLGVNVLSEKVKEWID